MADNVELIVRFHPVASEDVTLPTADFGAPEEALQAIARALDERRSVILDAARYNREAGQNTVANACNAKRTDRRRLKRVQQAARTSNIPPTGH